MATRYCLKKGNKLKIFKRMFASKEVRGVLGVLDEADCKFNCQAFTMIKGLIEDTVFKNSADIEAGVCDGKSPRELAYYLIYNIAADHLESGRYHAWYGILNPTGIAPELRRIFNAASDELVHIGVMDAEDAAKDKIELLKNIEEA